MNHKRNKPRKQVRCTSCTPHKWMGNAKDRFKHSDERERDKIPDRPEKMAPRTKRKRKKPWKLITEVSWGWGRRGHEWVRKYEAEEQAEQALRQLRLSYVWGRFNWRLVGPDEAA